MLSWLNRAGPLAIPRFIWLLFAADAALGLAYLIDAFAGHPLGSLAHIIDLDGESNLPTWYSSIQWFVVFCALTAVADGRVSRSNVRSWLLWLVPLVFLLFSMDEVVQVHESVGLHADALLPGGTRAGTAVHVTGLFFLVVGLPFVIGFSALILGVRPYLQRPPGALTKLVVGMTMMIVGAVGFDFLANFVEDLSTPAIILIYIEESLEMFGATVILWGSYQLLAPAG